MTFRTLFSLLALIVLFVFPMHASAQDDPGDPPTTPPGYSEPSDVTNVTQYRLPTWTFTTVTLNLDGGTSREQFTGSDASGSDLETTRSNYNALTTPQLRTFTESEARQFEMVVSGDLALDGNTSDREGDAIPNREASTSGFGTVLDIDLDWNEYVANEVFLAARTNLLGDYSRSSEETSESGTQIVDLTETEVLYTSGSRLGVGFGRIRDVTPVFRALRVRERLNRLGRQNAMGMNDVQAAARQFARRPGYSPVYDRPDKYFWNDLFSRAEGANANLQPYEVFYVAEALEEPIARRFEGYEVTAGINLSYSNRLQKRDAEFQSDARERSLRHSYGPFLRGEYVTNLNLRQQISLQGDVQYTVPTDDESIIDNRLGLTGSADWLWEVADRYRVRTRADLLYTRSKGEGSASRLERTSTDWTSSLESNLTVFLENRLALTTGVGFRYGRSIREVEGVSNNDETSQNGLFVNVGVRYFLFRNLSM